MWAAVISVLIIVVIILLYLFRGREQYSNCGTRNCERIKIGQKARIDILNPFIYPYSVTNCPEELADNWYLPVKVNTATVKTIDPLVAANLTPANNSVFTSRSVPDHEFTTN